MTSLVQNNNRWTSQCIDKKFKNRHNKDHQQYCDVYSQNLDYNNPYQRSSKPHHQTTPFVTFNSHSIKFNKRFKTMHQKRRDKKKLRTQKLKQKVYQRLINKLNTNQITATTDHHDCHQNCYKLDSFIVLSIYSP